MPQAVQDITDAVAKAAQCPREAVTVVIREVDTSYWGTAGTLASDRAHPVKPTMSVG
ncbi:tautomerase family protein [Streptomyces sp. L500]